MAADDRIESFHNISADSSHSFILHGCQAIGVYIPSVLYNGHTIFKLHSGKLSNEGLFILMST